MDFRFTDEQLELQKQIAAFALEESLTLSPEYEEKSLFPAPLFKKIAARGWIGLTMPPEYGGQAKGALEYSILMEELSKQLLFNPQANIQVCKAVLAGGTETQKQSYLPRLIKGEYVGAIAISEPGSGSSFKNLKTAAVKEGDHFVISGRKAHINLAKEADVFVLLARTEAGLSNFIIKHETPGLSFEKGDPIAARTAPIYDIILDRCPVPLDCLLGSDGRAIDTFFSIFNLSRIGNASQLLGYARGCLACAVQYARNRAIGDKTVTDFQGIQWTLAELVADIEAARLVRNKAAWAEDNHLEHTFETATAKFMAGRVAEKVANSVFSLVGGSGLYRAAPYQRYWNEITMGQVAGGSREILKNTMAKEILKTYQF